MIATKLSANDHTGNRILAREQVLWQRITAACLANGREPESLSLLAVSKTQPMATMQAAYRAGLRQFGENYLQEALDKIRHLPADCEWHFIGPIQTNKTRPIAEHFAWVHGLAREKIAQRLNAQRPAAMPPLKVCIQVNVSGETSKSGLTQAELPALIRCIRELPRLELMGLMCLPQASGPGASPRAAFRQLRELRDRYLPAAPTLSMGMSDDLEAAIAEGSTMVRIGTALFGARPTST